MKDQPQWVTLYMVKDNQASTDIPDTVTGLMMMETPDKYVIGCMLVYRKTPTGFVKQPSEGLNFINKRFVWRVEHLPRQPDFNSEQTDDLDNPDYDPFEGGLG